MTYFLLGNWPLRVGHKGHIPGSGLAPAGAKRLAAACKSLVVLRGHWERPPTAEQAQVRTAPRADVSVLDTWRSKVHEPHPGPALKETWLHLIVDSSISPSLPTSTLLVAISDLLCTTHCVVGTSANFCRLKAPHFLGGPTPWKAQLDVLLLGCAQVRNC